jgi:hypothetical protein
MIPFNLCHFQKTVDQIERAAVSGVTRRRFILSDVPALKSARAVHWRQPPGYVTKKFQRPADDGCPQFTTFFRPTAKTGKHFTNQSAMVHFIRFNLANCLALIRRVDRMPMTAIRVGGRQFT